MRPGRGPEKNRLLLVVALTGVLPLAVITYVTVRVAGRGPEKGPAPTGDQLDTAGHFFLCVAVILVVAHLGGMLADRLGQPRVVGEICAGIALGPSLLGQLSPATSGWLFPKEVLPMLDALGQLGLVLFVFGVGRELGSLRLRGTAQRALLVSKASLLVPFAAGAAIAVPLTASFLGKADDPLAFVLFIGCALSVTAFPVLARVLSDLGITRTEHGRLSLFAAAFGDAVIWLVLAAILAMTSGSDSGAVIRNAVVVVVVTAVFLGPLRRLLARWKDRGRDEQGGTGGQEDGGTGAGETAVMALLAAGVAATATLTASVGVHALIGALLVGVVWPARHTQATRVADRLAGTAKVVLLPFFFFGFGLTLDQDALPLDRHALLVFACLLGLAVITKVAGPAFAARLTGFAWYPALAVGVLLSTRGLTELVVIRIGYDAGIIDQRLFAILTLVALVTTMLTRPLLRLIRRGASTEPPGSPAAVSRADAPRSVTVHET